MAPHAGKEGIVGKERGGARSRCEKRIKETTWLAGALGEPKAARGRTPAGGPGTGSAKVRRAALTGNGVLTEPGTLGSVHVALQKDRGGAVLASVAPRGPCADRALRGKRSVSVAGGRGSGFGDPSAGSCLRAAVFATPRLASLSTCKGV